MIETAPLIVINAVGLTRRLLSQAPRLKTLADSGWARSLREVVPAVTCTAQATILTGREPGGHGVVTHARRAAALFETARAGVGAHLLGLDLDTLAATDRGIADPPPVDPGPAGARVTRVFGFTIRPGREGDPSGA